MPLLGGKIETSRDLYLHRLGAALTMERTIAEMLPQLAEEAHDPRLRQALEQHLSETRGHIGNLERAFEALGAEVDDSPCPTIEGLEKEGQATIKKTDDKVVDAVILAGAAETEHHEIAVYEGLITHAEARGASAVVELLKRNLADEQHTLQELQQVTKRIAGEGVTVAA